MALLADGLHMASHATALSISFFAYVYARRHARDERFSFGTGKVNSLAGFTGAVILALFALLMVWESIGRFIHPVQIAFDQALLVAVLGLLVNGASVLVLGHDHVHHDDDHHEHDHAHHDDDHHEHDHHEHGHVGHGSDDELPHRERTELPPDNVVDAAGQAAPVRTSGRRHHDHNLRAAYLHVLADALTSLLAIVALLAGKYRGYDWLDPLMGIVGAALVARWSMGLLKTTSRVLLDHQGPAEARNAIRDSLEANSDDEVVDLHLWPVGPGHYALIVGLVTSNPRPPSYYRRCLPSDVIVDHVTIEVWPRG
jgi:cation diffusion facilitator family transporter